MSFPLGAKTVLDTFTGAGTALAAPWAAAIGITAAGLATQDGAGRCNGAADTAAYYSGRQFGPDAEVQLDIPVLPVQYIAVFLAEQVPTNSTTDTGYEIQYNGASQVVPNATQVFKHTGAATYTALGTTASGAFTAGDSIGAQKVGTLLMTWRKTGGVWSMRASVNDTTTVKAGYTAFQIGDTTARGDNFSAGTIVTPPRIVGRAEAINRASLWCRGWVQDIFGIFRPRPSSWHEGWIMSFKGILVPQDICIAHSREYATSY